MQRDEVEALIFASGPASSLAALWRELDGHLVALGLERFAKTVSISYTAPEGKVVAAVHADTKNARLQVPIALPVDHIHPRLHDASLLRWRTMPLALHIAEISDIDDEAMALIEEALELDRDTAQETSSYVSDRDRRIREARESRGKSGE